MNQQHRRVTDVISARGDDQPNLGGRSLPAGKQVVDLKPAAAMPREVEEIFEAFELDMGTPQEVEEFLRAWEELPDEARLIF